MSLGNRLLANDPGASLQGYILKKLYVEHGGFFFYSCLIINALA
jgi:hypothetical protein